MLGMWFKTAKLQKVCVAFVVNERRLSLDYNFVHGYFLCTLCDIYGMKSFININLTFGISEMLIDISIKLRIQQGDIHVKCIGLVFEHRDRYCSWKNIVGKIAYVYFLKKYMIFEGTIR